MHWRFAGQPRLQGVRWTTIRRGPLWPPFSCPGHARPFNRARRHAGLERLARAGLGVPGAPEGLLPCPEASAGSTRWGQDGTAAVPRTAPAFWTVTPVRNPVITIHQYRNNNINQNTLYFPRRPGRGAIKHTEIRVHGHDHATENGIHRDDIVIKLAIDIFAIQQFPIRCPGGMMNINLC